MIPSLTGETFSKKIRTTSTNQLSKLPKSKFPYKLTTKLNVQQPRITSNTKDQFKLAQPSIKDQLKICYLNAGSIGNKMNELKLLVEVSSYDLVFIVETWLKPNTLNSLICPRGYSVIRRDRPVRLGGGVLVLYKSHLPVLEIRHFEDTNIEYLCIDILSTKHTIPTRFLCCYIPPNYSRDRTCIQNLCVCIKSHNSNNSFYILGDFNMPYIDWGNLNSSSGVGKLFLDFCAETSLCQKIHESTTINNSVLDLLFCNVFSERNLLSIDVLDPGFNFDDACS